MNMNNMSINLVILSQTVIPSTISVTSQPVHTNNEFLYLIISYVQKGKPVCPLA